MCSEKTISLAIKKFNNENEIEYVNETKMCFHKIATEKIAFLLLDERFFQKNRLKKMLITSPTIERTLSSKKGF